MEWTDLKKIATAEDESRAALAAAFTADDRNGEIALRLARACARDGRLAEALAIYERAAELGTTGIEEERSLVARHVGDFPDRGTRSA